MRSSVSRALALTLGFASASLPRQASARELAYRAPAGCPSQADVAARLEAGSPAGREARIDVSAVRRGFRGEVVLGEGERRLARSVEAQTCAAVVDALALVIALDRDEPEAREDDAAPASPGAASSTSPTLGGDPPHDTAGVQPGPPSAARPELAVGVGASGTSFTNGTVLLAMTTFVELARIAPWLAASRASFSYSFPAATSVDDAIPQHASIRPQFQLVVGGLDVCPVSFARTRGATFSLSACAHGELGSLQASSSGDASTRQSRLWSSAGGLVRGRVSGGSTRLFVETSGGLLVPLVRDRFHFAENDSAGPAVDGPAAPALRAPPAQWTLALGAGLVLW